MEHVFHEYNQYGALMHALGRNASVALVPTVVVNPGVIFSCRTRAACIAYGTSLDAAPLATNIVIIFLGRGQLRSLAGIRSTSADCMPQFVTKRPLVQLNFL